MNKTQIIKRIRTLQKRAVPTAKFYSRFNVDDLKTILKNAKLDHDLWLFEKEKLKIKKLMKK